MPRGPRDDYPGCLHHVMVRGIERGLVFRDDEDRDRFLRRLSRVLSDTGTRCHAFALMPNHVHLLLETGPTPLSRAMLRLGTGHALEFNRRHDRCGHLFQNRFRSIPIPGETGFLEVVRYIHLNPVRAGIVPDLDALGRWPWTGHAVLLGNRSAPFLAARDLLARFADDPREARLRLLDWMARDDPSLGRADPGSVAGDPPPDAPPAPPDPGQDDGPGARAALRRDGWDIDRVIGIACPRLGVEEALLRAGRRTACCSRARRSIALLASDRLGATRTDIARATGVTPQAISRALDRADSRDPGLRTLFPELWPPGPGRTPPAPGSTAFADGGSAGVTRTGTIPLRAAPSSPGVS